jgi:hypothetical protein
MELLKLTKSDFKDTDSYYKEYCGTANVADFAGHIEIEANLGWVKFVSLKATGRIFAQAGSGIEAGWGIKAGSGIEAGWGIKAGSGIEAGWGIKAGTGIEAGTGIKAGWGIEAGWGIKAGSGIEAGLSIRCKAALSTKLRVFAGLKIWSKPTPEEMEIECKRFDGGEIAYGTLKTLE